MEGLHCPKRGDGQLIVSPGTKILNRLRSMCSVKKIYNISHIEPEFGILDLANQVRKFLECNVYETANDPELAANTTVSDATVQAYTSLEIPVPSQDIDDNNAYQLQQVHMTGGQE